ncbi:MAG: O-antigen ligase family protein [Clostridiales bacterium]
MRKITKGFLGLLLFSPVISIITYNKLGHWNFTSYVILFTILYGIVFLFSKVERIVITNFMKFSFFWVVYYSLSGIFIAFDGDYLKLLNNKHLSIFFILLIIYNSRFNDRFINRSITIFKITIIVSAIVSILQVYNKSFLVPQESNEFFSSKILENIYLFRRPSIFGFIDSNALGLAFMPLVALLIAYMLKNKKKGYLLYLILAGLVALLSNSRYVIIGFIIITFQIFIYQKVNIKGLLKYLAITIIIAILGFRILKTLGYDLNDWFSARLFAEGAVTETTRYKALATFLEFFPNNYLLGTGVMTKEVIKASNAIGSSHIHVGYLSHLVMYGVVGCVFLYGFWSLLLKRFYRTAKKTNYWGAFFAFLIFLFSFATMSQPSIFFYGLIFALVFDKYYSDLDRIHNLLKKT